MRTVSVRSGCLAGFNRQVRDWAIHFRCQEALVVILGGVERREGGPEGGF